LKKINVQPDVVTYTSDYFYTIQGYALYMIENGLAYMDNTPQEQMQKERLERVNSKHREQTPADALKQFEEMCSGSEEGGKWCLRAKIDMQNDNGTMRDPVMFRQNLTPHHRSGTTFKAYPTYVRHVMNPLFLATTVY
jgi:glutamyl-tRNA synthetase